MNISRELEKAAIKRYIELNVLQARNSLTLDQADELYHLKEYFKRDIARIKKAAEKDDSCLRPL